MRDIRLKPVHLLAALVTAALLMALAWLASNPSGVRAVTTTPSPTPSPTATAAPTATTAPIQVNATEADFTVSSVPSSAANGPVQFNVTNHGAIAHEFVIMQTDNPPNALLYDDSTHKAVEEAPGQVDVGEIGGEDPFLLPGHTESDTFDLAPGRYVLLCNIPDHYKAGMYTSFTVGSIAPATPVPTSSPIPAPTATVASLPRSGGPPADAGFPWLWLVGGLALIGGVWFAGPLFRRG